MRYFRIFLLHFQNLLAHPGRSVVRVIIYIFSSLLFLAFLRGVFQHTGIINTWTLSTVTTYYFLLIIAGAVLMTHPEEPILRDDIERGEIDGRLLKPLSYYWLRFYYEIPYRIFQAILGIAFCSVLFFFFGNVFTFSSSATTILLTIIMAFLAFFISFTMKMVIATVGFWTIEIRGLRELIEIVITLFAGYILPINLMPGVFEHIAYVLPFAYIIYFPIVAFQGQLALYTMLGVIGVQVAWLVGFAVLYKFLWRKALKQFASVGH